MGGLSDIHTRQSRSICHQTMNYCYGCGKWAGCLAGVLRGHFAQAVAAGATHRVQHYDGDGHHRHADGVDHDRLVRQRRVHLAPVHRMPRVSTVNSLHRYRYNNQGR